MVISCALADVYPRSSTIAGTVAVKLCLLAKLTNHEIYSPIGTNSVRPEHNNSGPDLPLRECSFDVTEGDPVGVGDTSVARSSLKSESIDNELFLVRREKFGCLWVVGEDEEEEESHGNRYEAFEDEDPLPAMTTSNAFHMLDAKGKESREGTGHRCCRVEDGHALHDLVSLVPDGEQIHRGREETTFSYAQKESRNDKAFVGFDETHESHDSTLFRLVMCYSRGKVFVPS